VNEHDRVREGSPSNKNKEKLASYLVTKGLITWKQGTPGKRGTSPTVVKKYLSSHATPGTRGEVQKAITRSHVTLYSK